MGHYDDIRDRIEEKHAAAVKKRTGLTPREHERMKWLEDEIRKYNEFMNIEAKISELRKLKRKLKND